MIDTQKVNRETTTNFEVDKFGFQEVDPIHEGWFSVTTDTFNWEFFSKSNATLSEFGAQMI